MKATTAFKPDANINDEQLTNELCRWIEQNLDCLIGWAELSEQTKLSQKELHALFIKYKKTTPMSFIHELRESKKAKYFDKNRISPIFVKDN
jgi:AraC-like DNA-binding protein